MSRRLDIKSQQHICDFAFTAGDAAELPFPRFHFDAAVSIGLFEHIQPIEKLCLAVSEIARVARRYCVIVPSIGTLIEPHVASPLWGIRAHDSKRRPHCPINYFSDEAWLQFSGFEGARVKRFWYAPGFQNLMIYRR